MIKCDGKDLHGCAKKRAVGLQAKPSAVRQKARGRKRQRL